MVWRARVRDNEKFYSPLGLESEGIAIDFQVGVNDNSLRDALLLLPRAEIWPRESVEWLRRRRAARPFYASQFKHVFGRRLDDVWDDWIAFEHEYQKASLAKLGLSSDADDAACAAWRWVDMSRGFVDTKTNSLLPLSDIRLIGFIGRMDLASGKLTKLQEIKGMMLYKVTSVAFDEQARTAYYTEDNYAFRDLMAVNVDTGRRKMLIRDARIGDRGQSADKSIWGIRHENGLATIVRVPPPYAGFNQVHTFKYGEVPFDLDISPDGKLLSASFGEINGTQTVRVWKLDELATDIEPVEVANSPCHPRPRRASSSLPTERRFTGRPIIRACRTSSVRSSRRKVRRREQRFDRFFRPIPQPDGSSSPTNIAARVSSRSACSQRCRRTSERSSSSARSSSTSDRNSSHGASAHRRRSTSIR